MIDLISQLEQLEEQIYKLQYRMTYYGEAITAEDIEFVMSEFRRIRKNIDFSGEE